MKEKTEKAILHSHKEKSSQEAQLLKEDLALELMDKFPTTS